MTFSTSILPTSRLTRPRAVPDHGRVPDHPRADERARTAGRPDVGPAPTEAYPAGFWCGYRRVAARRAGRVLAVTRWAHNGTSWVSLDGELTGWTLRAVARVLRSEDRSAKVVLNAGGLRAVEPSCLSDLRTVCAAVVDRGVALTLVEAPEDLVRALATLTGPGPQPG